MKTLSLLVLAGLFSFSSCSHWKMSCCKEKCEKSCCKKEENCKEKCCNKKDSSKETEKKSDDSKESCHKKH
jgi:hypothetical protein